MKMGPDMCSKYPSLCRSFQAIEMLDLLFQRDLSYLCENTPLIGTTHHHHTLERTLVSHFNGGGGYSV